MYKEVSIGSATRSIDIEYREGWGFHHTKRPARTRFLEEGSIQSKSWYRHGTLHRENGPARIVYIKGQAFPGDTRTYEELEMDGAVLCSAWCFNGSLHTSFNSRHLHKELVPQRAAAPFR